MRVSRVEVVPRIRLAVPFTDIVVEVGTVLWLSTQLGFRFHASKWNNQYGKGAEIRVRLPLVGFEIYTVLDYYKDIEHYAETKKTNS